MTSVAWNNLGYYGKKLKNDFKMLDTLINNIVMLPKDEQTEDKKFRVVDDYTIDTVIKMMRQKTNIAGQVSKIVHEIDTTNRIENIEKLIEQIPMEMLAEAKVKIGQ